MKPIEEYTDAIIYHHLGMGDHVICNGLVRFIVKHGNFDHLALVVKDINVKNISRMFSDLSQLTILSVKDDQSFQNFYNQNNSVPLIRVGFEMTRFSEFDKSFYDCVNVPFNERWDSWWIERDLEQEARLIKELNIDDEYIFVHDSSSVGDFELKIDSNLRQIRPQKLECEDTMFDWIGVMERAKEIHCIDSSFMHIVDSYQFNNKKYYHTIKSSQLNNGIGFTLKNDWELVNYG